MATQTHTEYAVQMSTGRRDDQRTVEIAEGHETDRAWNERQAKAERAWQESVGITPDARLVARTVTTSDWYGV